MFARDTFPVREKTYPAGNVECPARRAPDGRGERAGGVPGCSMEMRVGSSQRQQPGSGPFHTGPHIAVTWASYALWLICLFLAAWLLVRAASAQLRWQAAAAQSMPAAKGAKVVIDLRPASAGRSASFQEKARPGW
jgi:hypothetical protein